MIESINLAIDANPTNYYLRLILADAFDENGNHKLAQGYRKLAKLELCPLELCKDVWYWPSTIFLHFTFEEPFLSFYDSRREAEDTTAEQISANSII